MHVDTTIFGCAFSRYRLYHFSGVTSLRACEGGCVIAYSACAVVPCTSIPSEVCSSCWSDS